MGTILWASRLLLGLLFLLAHGQCQGTAGPATGRSYPKSIALSYELLGASRTSPSSLANVEYDPKTLEYTLSSWTPPSIDSLKSTSQDPTSAPLVRILLPNGVATITSLDAFDTKLSQNVNIWVAQDASGEVVSASVQSETPPPLTKEEELQRQKEERLRKRGKAVPNSKPKPKPKPKKAKDAVKEAVVGEKTGGPVVRVNLLTAGYGPVPKLNSRQPPQVDAEGREVVAEEQQEKSFLQKYWYIMLAVAFLLISSGGGGS